MRQHEIMAAWACALAVASPVMADAGQLGVRVRALHMAVDSGTSPSIGVDVEDRWIPELDLSYWMSERWALELVLTYPQKHDVRLGGARIGDVKHVPPTLMLQYHFMPRQTVQPYVGVGLNYTRFTDVDLADGAITMDKNSWGAAVQVGFDYRLSKTMVLNVDAKWVNIESDLTAGGTRVATLKVDPWLVGIGLGWRF